MQPWEFSLKGRSFRDMRNLIASVYQQVLNGFYGMYAFLPVDLGI